MTRAIYIPLLTLTLLAACRGSFGDGGEKPAKDPAQNNPAVLYVDPVEEVRSGDTLPGLDEVRFTSVYAYSFNIGEHGQMRNIIHDNGLNPTAKLPGKKMDEKQTKEFLSIISDTNAFGGTMAACFEPRMGIVFYDKGTVTGHVSICFDCNSMDAYPGAPGRNYHETEEKNWRTGFSSEGRKRLKALCASLGLEQCNNHSELFDK